jgi:hypothetical protein
MVGERRTGPLGSDDVSTRVRKDAVRENTDDGHVAYRNIMICASSAFLGPVARIYCDRYMSELIMFRINTNIQCPTTGHTAESGASMPACFSGLANLAISHYRRAVSQGRDRGARTLSFESEMLWC